jgi:hypothetical protein
VSGTEDGGWLDFDGVERWVAEAQVRDAVDARQRERWLRRQAEDEAAFAGLLLDLAERRVAVVATTTGGRRHIGRVEAVGADFAAITGPGGQITLLALGAVAAVSRARAGETRLPDGIGRRTPETPPAVMVTMADVIGHAVERRPRVRLFAGASGVGGELRALGADVVTLYTDGDPAGLAYVRLASVSELSFLDSG